MKKTVKSFSKQNLIWGFSGYQLVNSTEGTSSGVFSSESQQCIACPFGKYIVRPNNDVCTKCPKGTRY